MTLAATTSRSGSGSAWPQLAAALACALSTGCPGQGSFNPCDPDGNCPGSFVCQAGLCYPADNPATGSTSGGSSSGTAGAAGTSGDSSTGGNGSGAASSSGGTTSASGGFTGSLGILAGQAGGAGFADGVGSAARFNLPSQLAYDGKGHLLVADSDNNAVRSIDTTSWTVSTLAGSSLAGSNDGVGTLAGFNHPTGLAVDGTTGLLYVADSQNDILRRIDPTTSYVSTYAGRVGHAQSSDNTGVAAAFNYPSGLAADGSGDLFVADTGNDTIRWVNLATAYVTTIAGQIGDAGADDGTESAASFNGPQGVACDGTNVYVADSANDTLRMLAVGSGTVTTIAGSPGNAGLSNGHGSDAALFAPIGLAFVGPGSLYVADSLNDAIRVLSTGEGLVSTLAGIGLAGTTDGPASVATFDSPSGVASDGQGNVYVADSASHTIRLISTSPDVEVSTVGGTPTGRGDTDSRGSAASFSDPDGLAFDGVGTLYVADIYNDGIRQIALATQEVTTLSGTFATHGSADGPLATASFIEPNGVAYDGAGNLFVADTGNETIRQIALDAGVVTTLAGQAGEVGSADGIGSAARFNLAVAVACDGSGHVYASDYLSDTIRQIDVATRTVTTLAGIAGTPGSLDGTGTSATLDGPGGLGYDGAGNLYFTDVLTAVVRKIALSTAAVTTVAGRPGFGGSQDGAFAVAQFSYPKNVIFDPRGFLYVADNGNDEIRKLSLAAGTVSTLIGSAGRSGIQPGPLPALIHDPLGLALGPNHTLYLSSGAENVILDADLP